MTPHPPSQNAKKKVKTNFIPYGESRFPNSWENGLLATSNTESKAFGQRSTEVYYWWMTVPVGLDP
jgi:hypothetical protein